MPYFLFIYLGFKGQARVILPTMTSCYECSLDMLNKRTTYPICTIANTPRLPEHCIEWASQLEWPKVWGNLYTYILRKYKDLLLLFSFI